MNENYVCLLLGSNIQPEKNLPEAVEKLSKVFPIICVSDVWETPPHGMKGSNFLNAAVVIQNSPESISQLKIKLRQLEQSMGRVRIEDKYASRTIDIDVVISGATSTDKDLWKLAHIAVPVSNLWPCMQSPESGERLGQIARKLREEADVHRRMDVNLGFVNNHHNMLCLDDNLGTMI